MKVYVGFKIARALTRWQTSVNDSTFQTSDLNLPAHRVDIIFAKTHDTITRL